MADDYITADEFGAAIERARAESPDGRIDLAAVCDDLRAETGREFAPQPPEKPFLTEKQIARLPAEMQDHYRHHSHLRGWEDIPYLPRRFRDSFLRLQERHVESLPPILAEREGEEAAQEATEHLRAQLAANRQKIAELDAEDRMAGYPETTV